MLFKQEKTTMVTAEQALPGRQTPISLPEAHHVLPVALSLNLASHHSRILLGMGCFWGAERLFWQLSGVVQTLVGYAGGFTPNPSYEEVCSGKTGHTEVVLVDYDPEQISLASILEVFWQNHDPTQGMRQWNDIGTQYRSALYPMTEQQKAVCLSSLEDYQRALSDQGYGPITTEIKKSVPFYAAEDYHQQYLAKNPQGYCGLKGLGVACQQD